MVRSFASVALMGICACAVDPSGLPAADAAMDCREDRGCDDSIVCTDDRCVDGSCTHVALDSRCAGAEVCVEGVGCRSLGTCEPSECSEALRDPSSCEVGACSTDDGSCVAESTCAPGESCCGDGSCRDCDDGNPCTEDRCDGGECVSTPLSDTPCDDGIFCNGVDVCDAGTCVHEGDPCEAPTLCAETRCVGCVDQSDCPDPMMPPFGACEAGDVCALMGTQTRMVTTYDCVSDECVGTTTPETQPCARDTDGETCGLTSATGWSMCGDYGSTCGEMGTQTQMVLARECAAGACTDVMRTEMRDCMRDTDGVMCGAMETATGACEPSPGGAACSSAGQRTITTTTYACADGTCAMDVTTTTEACTRDTDGEPCDPSNPCGGECTGGTCDTSANDGDSCNDGLGCTNNDRCSSGTCQGSDDCRGIDGDCGFCLGRCDCRPNGGSGACMCL